MKKILYSNGFGKVLLDYPYKLYEIIKPEFSEEEKNLSELIESLIKGKKSRKLIKEMDSGFLSKLRKKILIEFQTEELMQSIPNEKELNELIEKVKEFIEENTDFVKHVKEIAREIVDNTIGYEKIASLLRDPMIEEIMQNKENNSVFVVHKKQGMCKTSISFNEKELNDFMKKIIKSIGKELKENLIDGRLPNKARINITRKQASPEGITFTIRKFTKKPLSLIELIKNNTLSIETAAFLWLALEGMKLKPLNIIVSGGSSSGKTTLLNALIDLIPLNERIISIEDTLEIDFGERENIVRLEAKPKIGKQEEISMNELLKNALRMRPDRIIIGEVRGNEANTLFTAMNTGHEGVLGTIHANNARDSLLRLKRFPMEVPEDMLSLIDLIIVMKKTYLKEKGETRMIAQIAEISSMEGKPLLANLFEYNNEKECLERTEVPSHTIEVLSQATGYSKSDLNREIIIRKKLLEFIIENELKEKETEKFIQEYYFNPKTVLEQAIKRK